MTVIEIASEPSRNPDRWRGRSRKLLTSVLCRSGPPRRSGVPGGADPQRPTAAACNALRPARLPRTLMHQGIDHALVRMNDTLSAVDARSTSRRVQLRGRPQSAALFEAPPFECQGSLIEFSSVLVTNDRREPARLSVGQLASCKIPNGVDGLQAHKVE